MRALTAVLLALCIPVAGCERTPPAVTATTGSPSTAAVTAEPVADGVRITNGTATGVAFVVVDPTWLGLLVQCDTPGPDCIRLPAGGSIVVPRAEMHGVTSATTDVEVRTWRVVPDASGGHRVEQVSTVVVRL